MNSIHFLKTHRLAGFAALLALLFLSSACSKDSGDTSGDSSTTTGLKISLGGIAEGGSESLEKSALQAETVTQKLDSDMTVEYTLAPTAASLTRSTSTMTDGVKYRVLVYTSGGTYVAYRDYTAGSESATAAIPVDAGDYQVVAYSYNTSDDIADTPSATSLTVSPDKDLLYYSTTVNVTDGTSNPVAVTFDHKFSKVTVVTSASTLGAKINACSATVSPGYQAAMALPGGVVTSTGTAATQTVSWATLGDTAVTSTSRTVYTNAASSLTLTLGFTLGSSTSYSGQTLAFTKTLVAGYAYTLTANLKNNFIIGGVRWAKGNLYKTASASGIWGTQEYYSSDYTYGDYWNWKTTSPSTEYSSAYSASTDWGGVNNLTNDPCNQILAGAWRLPTYTDQVNLINSGYALGTKNAVFGGYFKVSTVPSSNQDSYLFLPGGGYRRISSIGFKDSGSRCLYWTSTSYSATQGRGLDASTIYGVVAVNPHLTSHGFTIRCVQDL